MNRTSTPLPVRLFRSHCPRLFSRWLVAALMLALSPVAGAVEPPYDEADQEQLVEVLRSESASTFEKAKACQRLAVIGDATAVPELTRLLEDPQLSGYARTALERIPGTEADQALIGALNRADGRQLAGVIHSIAERGVESAKPQLERLAGSEQVDPVVRQAASRALERFRRNASDAPDGEELTDSELGAALRADAADRFRRGLHAARRRGPMFAPQIAGTLSEMSPARKIQALVALADLGNSQVTDQIRPLLEDPDPAVAAQAFEALVHLGEYSGTEELPAAIRERPQIAPQALPSLARLDSPALDRIVEERLRDAVGRADEPASRLVGLAAYAAERHLSGTTDALLQLAESEGGEVQSAALRAAGATASVGQLERLLTTAEQLSNDLPPVTRREAVEAALVRLPRDGAAEVIGMWMREAPQQRRDAALSYLAFLGGERALQIVSAVARRLDEASVDAATRVLGEWLTPDVAPTLASLAREIPDAKYRLRTLRGYLRVGRQLEMSNEERAQLVADAFQLSTRDAERNLALEIIRRYPSLEGLRWLVERIDAGMEDLPEPLRRSMLQILVSVATRVAEDEPKAVAALLADLEDAPLPESTREGLEPLK